jgi:hypothetical protein
VINNCDDDDEDCVAMMMMSVVVVFGEFGTTQVEVLEVWGHWPIDTAIVVVVVVTFDEDYLSLVTKDALDLSMHSWLL